MKPCRESQQFAEAFGVRLTPALTAWFDEQAWTRGGGAEFSQALSARQIVQPDDGTVWAGFMLPDTLPLASNEYGDWLCMRVDTRGELAEIVLWSHAGGDWLPYGRDWPEALLFDAASEVLYRRRHEFQVDTQREGAPHAWAEWAADWLDREARPIVRFWRPDVPRDLDPLSALWQSNIAVSAAEHDLVLRALDAELRSVLTLPISQKLGIAWEPDAVSWLFDTRLVPDSTRESLCRFTRIPSGELFAQDWEAAESRALRLMAQRHDLGWAFDIAGWAAERRGDLPVAIERYLGGVRPSVFSDNTIRFRTHWFADGYGKFSAARLYELRDQLPSSVRRDPYLSHFLANDNRDLRPRIRDYWLELARSAERRGDHPSAYQYYYLAGWDMGLQEIEDFRGIFAGLCDNAEKSHWPALAAVARLHQRFLPR